MNVLISHLNLEIYNENHKMGTESSVTMHSNDVQNGVL